MFRYLSDTRCKTSLLFGAIVFCAIGMNGSPFAIAEEKVALTGARLLSRIARQSRETRPTLFDLPGEAGPSQLAIVIDGTTSMKQELGELPRFLKDILQLMSHDSPESLQVALLVYRDSRSPSGVVTVVSDFSKDHQKLIDKVRDLKIESGEPYFYEAMDQGIHSALELLSWSGPGGEMKHRMLILADAPPYNEDHENRKYRTAQLLKRCEERQIRVDALLLNSGFPVSGGGGDGTSREVAVKTAPSARDFFSLLTGKTKGVFVDLWDESQISSLQETTVLLGDLPALPPVNPKSPSTRPTEDAWRAFLSKLVASVRAERPALDALKKLSESSHRKPTSITTFPVVYSSEDWEEAILNLNGALEEEPENPVLHLLLANVHAALATPDAYEDHEQAVIRHVLRAQGAMTDKIPQAVRDEIVGLHALFVLGDVAAAKEAFGKLTSAESEKQNPGCRLRASWSLLGLELGFWPISRAGSKTAPNLPACRELVRKIIQEWPDSVEALGLRQCVDSENVTQMEIARSLFASPRAN